MFLKRLKIDENAQEGQIGGQPSEAADKESFIGGVTLSECTEDQAGTFDFGCQGPIIREDADKALATPFKTSSTAGATWYHNVSRKTKKTP